MTAFSLGTFGFPEVHADGRPIKLALRKGLALLVYLAEAKGAVAREIVATLLWPETDRETGLARLRRLLHRIELTLGQQVFDRPHQSAMVSGSRAAGRCTSFRERLRSR
jgi:DNA-binding SARP family transcriptional activator